MATSILSQASNPVLKKSQPDVSLLQLRSTITDMDCMAQDAFSQIKSLAGLALLAMEQPATYCIMDALADLLTTIKEKAESTDNSINSAAEGMGCNYVNKAQRKRWAAERQAHEDITDGCAA